MSIVDIIPELKKKYIYIYIENDHTIDSATRTINIEKYFSEFI
jgi:hypothetical protein